MFRCALCSTPFETAAEARVHIVEEHPHYARSDVHLPRECVCSICSERFGTLLGLFNHFRIAHDLADPREGIHWTIADPTWIDEQCRKFEDQMKLVKYPNEFIEACKAADESAQQ